MNHHDHVNLIRSGVVGASGTWAELGSGSGAFTLVLAELVGEDGSILSIDRDAHALREQQRAIQQRYLHTRITYRTADFTQPLDLPPLDGLLMANALHFHRAQADLLSRLVYSLKPGGRFVLVEYNAEVGNQWVPCPISYPRWEQLAAEAGLTQTRQLARVPSRFLKEIYSAVSLKSG
jgi:ubiquinone/menaquinone biosynthesis C-methylase UbiE